MTTQLDIAKEALAQVGTRSTLTSLSDGSAEATYINLLYNPIRDFLLTEGDYDWSMITNVLAPAGIVYPWPYAYVFPSDALRIRQLLPPSVTDMDPRPIEWVVMSVLGVRRICSTQLATEAMYTSAVTEDIWDGIFHQSFVRMLASALAFALENRIEASKVKLDEALGFAGVGKLRDI